MQYCEEQEKTCDEMDSDVDQVIAENPVLPEIPVERERQTWNGPV
jgi:hypothetical protein